jgi:hypothetical protein
MTVPLVQGTLRYAYRVGTIAADQSTKNAAEGSTFAAALLPLVNYCNPASAATVAGEMKFGLFNVDTSLADYPDFAAVKTALESTYPCLGITCAQVGGLQGYEPDTSVAACTTAPSDYARWTLPPPPPMKQVASGDSVVVDVTAAGDLSDYDAAKLSGMECAMAVVAGVVCDAVTATVSAGSVIIQFIIVTEDAAATSDLISAGLSDAAAASSALGVTVETVPVVAKVTYAPPSTPPPSDSGLSTGAIVGIAVGGGVGLCIVLGIIAFMVMKKKPVAPKEVSPPA